MESLSIRRILFLQKPELLRKQSEQVRSILMSEFPNLEVVFASESGAVPEGYRADAVIAPTLPWLPDALVRLSSYRWIHFLSAGIEKIWSMDFDKSRVLMTKSSGVHSAPMSEYAIGAMLYFAKRFNRFVDQARRAEWHRFWLNELTGRQLTILGLGHIGQSIARRAKVFDMIVVGTQRQVRSIEYVDRVIEISEIKPELSRTDYLVVCLPLTVKTNGLVNDAFLEQLKYGSVLIDISRGGIVIGDAVVRALNIGQLSGAALDVFEQQPLPTNSELWRRGNVLLTPHVSGTTPYYLERALSVFVYNARALKNGLPLVTPVDVEAGY